MFDGAPQPERGAARAVATPLRSIAREVFTIDTRSLAAFRIAAALMLLVDLALRARFLPENYTDQGVLPREVVARDFPGTLPSIHAFGGSSSYEAWLFALSGVFAVMLLVGYRTRLATFFSWILVDSLQRRNFMVLETADDILRVMLFWSLLLPLGARFSIDARRAGARRPPNACSPASAALLLQTACVYLFSGWMKTGPEWTVDGSAIYYTLRHDYWARPLAEFVRQYPEPLRVMTPVVLWFERLGPLLLFLPVANATARTLMVLAFWGFMLGLGTHVDLGLIPWASAVAMLPFVPGPLWDRFAPLKSRSRPLDPEPPGQRKRAVPSRFLDAFVLIALALVAWVNLGTLSPRLEPSPAAMQVAQALRLQQTWPMYAPSPPRYDYWIAVRGRLADGASIDLLNPGGREGAGWGRVQRIHRDHRFKIFLERLITRKWPRRPHFYAQWLCGQWNRDATADTRLLQVAVAAQIAELLPEDRKAKPRTAPLARLRCPVG